MQVIPEEVLRQRIGEDQAFAAVKRAFRALANGKVRQPAPMALDFPERRGEVHVKAAFIEGSPVFAIKVASGFLANTDEGIDSGSGLLVVHDARTGAPLAILADNGYLTDLRTGAAGALALDLLAPPRVRRLGLLGTGRQGRHQLRAMARVRTLEQVNVWSPTAERLSAFCEEMSAELSLPVTGAPSAEAALRNADVVVTTTPTRSPIVKLEWLVPHVTLIAVGADGSHKHEIETSVLKRADKVIADDWSQCIRMGEIHHAIVAHALELNRIHSELGKVLTGERSGREGDEMIVCDLTGVGAQDAAIAEHAWRTLCEPAQMV
ncbi:MAG: ornithine cyclodeaminase family protein [Gemmatimonadetes bacterium]|nr:ornithine cyclodeaminase family protein [Gemmatimonadota bacterium]